MVTTREMGIKFSRIVIAADVHRGFPHCPAFQAIHLSLASNGGKSLVNSCLP